MKKIFVMFFACMVFIMGNIVSEAANADELEWSWTAPTTRADGTPFDMATEGAGYHVWFNDVQEVDSNGDPWLITPQSNQIVKTITQFNQEICISMTTVDIDGRESARSSPTNDSTQTACKTIFAPPGMPANIRVKINIIRGNP